MISFKRERWFKLYKDIGKKKGYYLMILTIKVKKLIYNKNLYSDLSTKYIILIIHI